MASREDGSPANRSCNCSSLTQLFRLGESVNDDLLSGRWMIRLSSYVSGDSRLYTARLHARFIPATAIAGITHANGVGYLISCGGAAKQASGKFSQTSSHRSHEQRSGRICNGAAGRPPQRILLVDDDELELELMADRLKALGFETHTVSDGSAALDLLRTQSFPVVITDWQMPRMDGIRLTENLRNQGRQ